MQREEIKDSKEIMMKEVDDIKIVQLEQERLKTTLKMFMSETKTRFAMQDKMINEIKKDMKEIQGGIKAMDERFLELYERFSERIHQLEIKVAKIMGGISLVYIIYQIIKGVIFK